MITDEAKLVKALGYAEHVKDKVKLKFAYEEQIGYLRDHLGLSGMAIGEKVTVQPTADKIPDGVARLQELIREYTTVLVEFVDEIRVFSLATFKLDDTQGKALRLRYLQLKEWKQIADQMGYVERNIYIIRKKGLIGLYDEMPEEWRSMELPKAEI